MPKLYPTVKEKIDRKEDIKKNYTAKEISTIFNLTVQRIGQLEKEGMPKEGDGLYNLELCAKWYIQTLQERLDINQNQTVVSEKIKLLKAKTKIAEIDVKKKEEQIADKNEIKDEIIKKLYILKDILLDLPGSISFDLAQKSSTYIKLQLEKKIKTILNQIAETF